MSEGQPRVTEAEWQALNLGSRALRELGAGLRRHGHEDLALESVRSAAALEGLGSRSVVTAARDESQEQEAER